MTDNWGQEIVFKTAKCLSFVTMGYLKGVTATDSLYQGRFVSYW